MDKEFPLDVLFTDGTVGKQLEDGKKVVAIKVDDKTCIGLRNKEKDTLDRCERNCDREAKRSKDGIVSRPPTLQTAKKWFAQKEQINTTIEMLQEAGIDADRFEGEILTCSRKGKFENYVFNTYIGEETAKNTSSCAATFRPTVSIDKTPEMPRAAQFDWDFIKRQVDNTKI